jgi:hypothetical protein
MGTAIRRLAPVKGGVAGGVDLLAKHVEFVMQTANGLYVTIVGKPGHGTSLLASRGTSAASRSPLKAEGALS